uniref:Uncharacterized protein LOC102803559 n=1 Tax=Saccoglossus kowalevskii TaxID=10224 RepID=A0ABM0MW54_SACKO|nr:PREDICTED: uncharacterized protein LOC102803559 [Saccoglossus kowalevskii]
MHYAILTKFQRNDIIVVRIGLTLDKLPPNLGPFTILDAKKPRFMNDFIEAFQSDSPSWKDVSIPDMRKSRSSITLAKLIPQPGAAIIITDILKNENYVTTLRKLTDFMQSGSWREVDKYEKQLMKQKMEPKSDLIIEQLVYIAICSCLRNDFNKADKLTSIAQNCVERAENRDLLEGRLNYLIGYRHMKERNFEKAFCHFDKALTVFKQFGPTFWLGTVYMHWTYTRYKTGGYEDTDAVIADLEISAYILGEPGHGLTYYLKQRVLFMMVVILLDCDSLEGRARNLNSAEQKIIRAQGIMNRYYSTRGDHRYQSKYAECHSLLAEACYHYRLGQIQKNRISAMGQEYTMGKEYAEKGKRIAIKYGFQSELHYINSFLIDFERLSNTNSRVPFTGCEIIPMTQ